MALFIEIIRVKTIETLHCLVSQDAEDQSSPGGQIHRFHSQVFGPEAIPELVGSIRNRLLNRGYLVSVPDHHFSTNGMRSVPRLPKRRSSESNHHQRLNCPASNEHSILDANRDGSEAASHTNHTKTRPTPSKSSQSVTTPTR